MIPSLVSGTSSEDGSDCHISGALSEYMNQKYRQKNIDVVLDDYAMSAP